MPLQHEARDLHFFISHTKHSRVYYISTFYFIPFLIFFNHQYLALISKRSCSFTVQRISYKFRTVERPLDTSVCLY